MKTTLSLALSGLLLAVAPAALAARSTADVLIRHATVVDV
jgi:hypothetical protein